MWFAILVVLVYVVSSVICIFLEALNLRHSTSREASVPKILRDDISEEEFEKSKAYTADKTRTGIAHSTATLFLGLFFLLFGFRHVESFTVEVTDPLLLQAFVLIGVFGGAHFLVSLVFRIYRAFVVEERYGFNRMTPGLLAVDTLKTLVIAGLLGAGLISISLWLVMTFSYWWILLWVVFILFQLAAVWIYPALILPLFNKLRPLDQGPLRKRIESVAESAGFTVKGISLMDASKRSRHSNAFFTGLGKTKKIVLFDTLLEKLDEDEIVAVVAHEIGHSKLNHIVRRFLLSASLLLGTLLIAWVIVESSIVKSAFGVSEIYTFLLYTVILLSASMTLFEPFTNHISRKHEFEADAYSASNTGSSEHLVSALKGLAKHNLSNLNPHPLYTLFNYSHPTLVERAAALKREER